MQCLSLEAPNRTKSHSEEMVFTRASRQAQLHIQHLEGYGKGVDDVTTNGTRIKIRNMTSWLFSLVINLLIIFLMNRFVVWSIKSQKLVKSADHFFP